MSGQSSGGMSTAESGMEEQTPNVTYDLISVIYHALQGCETYEMYADDAEQGGHTEIAQFFREVGQQDQERAERGQQLLMQCLQQDLGQQGQGARQQMQSGGRSGQMGGGSGSRGAMGAGSGSTSGGASGGGSMSGGTSGAGMEGGSSGSMGSASGGGQSGRSGNR
jgi:hypothetical protein